MFQAMPSQFVMHSLRDQHAIGRGVRMHFISPSSKERIVWWKS